MENATQYLYNLTSQINPYIRAEKTNMLANWGHLMSLQYGSKYYSYMWAEKYALELFNYIKQTGLLNDKVGERFRKEVLEQGGSKPEMKILIDLLGMEPTDKGFYNLLGIEL